MRWQDRHVEIGTPPDGDAPIVSLDDAKDHLHVTDSDSDAYIPLLVALATRIYEERACTSLAMRTLILYLDRFPCGGKPIYLPYGPVVTVNEITYLDGSGSTATLDDDLYTVNLTRDIPLIEPAYGCTWPEAIEMTGAVSVSYDAGYDDIADIPSMPIHAVKLLVAHFFENRESTSPDAIHEVTDTFSAIVDLDVHKYVPPQE